MTKSTLPALPLPGSTESAVDRITQQSGPAFMACYTLTASHSSDEMRAALCHAEAFLASVAKSTSDLMAAAERPPNEDVTKQVMMFISAWPVANKGDMAGYGAQLLDDLLSDEPCRYALTETLRKLRRSSRFLPSISEVLTELEVHQSRIRNTLAHIERLPSLIENLTAWAERQERAEADRIARLKRNAA